MRPWALLAGPVAHAALLCLLDGTHEVAGGLDKVTFPSIGVRHRQIFHRMASEGDAGLSAALGQGLRLRGHDIDSAEECSSCVGGEILDEGLRGSRESWAIERREAVGVSMPIREGLRLRGGIGEAAGSIVSYASGIALDVEGNEFREFGTGPGTLDLSSSRMEAMPDSYNQEDSLMDGAFSRGLRSAIALWCLALWCLAYHSSSELKALVKNSQAISTRLLKQLVLQDLGAFFGTTQRSTGWLGNTLFPG